MLCPGLFHVKVQHNLNLVINISLTVALRRITETEVKAFSEKC